MKNKILIAVVPLVICLAASTAFGQADQTGTVSVSLTVADVFTLALSKSSENFTGTGIYPGESVNNEGNPIVCNVKSNYGAVWYLKIKDDHALANATDTIPQASFLHQSTGGAGTHADAAYTAFTGTNAAGTIATFYTSTTAEGTNSTTGTSINSNLKVNVPTTQKRGTYTCTVTYTLSATGP
ncbi:MAG: hypothetical protein AB1393_12260 [Candidatus Edwardsbacteria bacterium]